VPVEISSTPLGEGPGWHGFVVRETGRSGMMREDAESLGLGGTGDAAMGNARALVGSAPLRDIVASMTDVIEKSCIEAAVELTSNNRVAAAEMLGLSRQSLYVKLRKYDLLRRGDED
jgi:DNA-binding NtrC family response regulator